MDEQQTKTVITCESVRDLLFKNLSARRRLIVFESIMYTVFYIPCMVFLCYMIMTVFVRWIGILALLIAIPLICIPIWRQLRAYISYLKTRCQFENGEYEIITCQVSYKTEHNSSRYGTSRYLYFEGFERVTVGRTQYVCASRGDEYILVYYRNCDTVELFFWTELYELQ